MSGEGKEGRGGEAEKTGKVEGQKGRRRKELWGRSKERVGEGSYR